MDRAAAPLLTTKLYVPSIRPGLVSRPHLIERLNEGVRLGRKLTLLSAPAGYGKTTLLSEWVHSLAEVPTDRGAPVPLLRTAWVSLDKGDNDPARFWSYVVSALQMIQAALGQDVLALLRSPAYMANDTPPPFQPLLTTLINDITALPAHPRTSDVPSDWPGPRPGRCLVLILDDYHVIQALAIHEAVTFLLDHLPPQMHLAIATRADPPLPIARLRGRGQVTELRQADLSFAPGQVTAFLNQAAGVALDSEDAAALAARTEGWIAGLQMAALSMRGRKDIPRFIAALTGSHEYIADYLVAEVLGQQRESVRAFLLQTSILDRLSGPLCDAVTGQDGGQQTLEDIQAANLFLISLDDERRWYRYHHLFASLLQQRLEQARPDTVPELHRRASVWFERNGLVAEAVGHALSGGDFDRVERLVADSALAMIYHGELATLAGWLEALPHTVVRTRPWLCVAQAWALGFAGRPGSVEPLLQDAERATESLSDRAQSQHIAGHIAAIRAYTLTQERDFSRASVHTRTALEHLPGEDRMVRGFATAVAGNVLRMSGDLAAGARAMNEAIALAGAAGANSLAIDIRCDLIKLYISRGQLHTAAAICQDALRLAGGLGGQGKRPLPIAGQVSAWLSLIQREWNDLAAALHHAREGLETCKRWGQAAYLGLSYTALAKALQAMGDASGALDAIRQAQQVERGLPSSSIAPVTAWEMQIRLSQGDTAAAQRWARASGLRIDDKLEFYRHQEYLTLAQTLVAHGEWSRALTLLARLLEMAERTEATGCTIEVLALQALALRASGQGEQALVALERALALAEPEGYVRTFVDQGAPMRPLLQKVVAHSQPTDYASRLLATLEAESQFVRQRSERDPLTVRRPSAEGWVDPLSEREQEVLRMLHTHLSRKEIADELGISVNTVRFHVKNIYGKLDVHSRSEAIDRARDLNLL
jgi:LuxR family maltose regulon positive regulatory protein